MMLRIEVDLAKGEKVVTPLSIPAPDNAELLSAVASPLVSGTNGLLKQTLTLRIGFYAIGTQVIPAFTYVIKGAKGTLLRQQVAEQKLMVTSVRQSGDITLADLRAQSNLPLRPEKYVRDLLLGLVLLLLLGYLAFRLKNKLDNRPAPAAAPPEKPHIVAKGRLADLANRNLHEQGKTKEYAFALSEIVRQYLENRYSFPALERTTAELRDDMAGGIIAKELQQPMGNFLESCDVIKFTDIPPAPDEPTRLMLAAHELIAKTKPAEVVS